jgi:hypothetical protein
VKLSVKLKAAYAASVWLISLFCSISYAGELDPTICGTRVAWFINGVQNNFFAADTNRAALESILATNKATSDIKVKLAHNPTAGVIDFIDVFNQKRREWSALTFKQLVEYFMSYQIPSWVGAGDRSRFEQSMRDGLSGYAYNVYKDADFQQIVSAIRLDITDQWNQSNAGTNKFKRVLLLAHSQGNLYANAVYEKLVDQEKVIDARAIRYYGIAPASAYQAGQGSRYILSNKDVVINALRRFTALVLPNNANVSWLSVVTNALSSTLEADWKASYQAIEGHSLTEVYLKSGFGMRSRITNEMRAMAGELKARHADSLPPSWAPITVNGTPALNWPDVSKVYWGNGPSITHKQHLSGAEDPAYANCGKSIFVFKTGACTAGAVSQLRSELDSRLTTCLKKVGDLITQGAKEPNDITRLTQNDASFETCQQVLNPSGLYYAAATGYYKVARVIDNTYANTPYYDTPVYRTTTKALDIAALCR